MRRIWWALAALVALVGLGARLWLMGTAQGTLNADEAYTGLQAFAILRGDLPVVIRGAFYTATLDCYLLAPVVGLFGGHVLILKLYVALWWALAGVMAWRLAITTLGRRWAAVAGLLVWVAPGALMAVAVRGYVAYASGLFVVVAAAWACTRVVGRLTWRTAAAAGALVGLAFYMHPMYATVALPMVLVPCWLHRREWRVWWVPSVVAAVAVNLPFITWNAVNGFPSLDQPIAAEETATERLSRFFTGLLPRAFGLRNSDGGWVYGTSARVVYALLLVLMVWGVVVLVRKGATGLVVALPAVLSWPLLSLFNNMGYVVDGRYAIIAFPFLVVCFVAGAADLAGRSVSRAAGRVRRFEPAFMVGAVVAWTGLLLWPWLAHNAPDRVPDPNWQTRALIDQLEEAGFTTARGDYWLTLPIEYMSDRRIHTGLDGYSWPVVIRFPDTQNEVQDAPPWNVAFVFEIGDEHPEAMPLPVDYYERREVGGAALYLPVSDGGE